MYSRLHRFSYEVLRKSRMINFNLLEQQCDLHTINIKKSSFPLTKLIGVLQYSSDNPSKCWNCNFTYKSDLFCSKCKVIQELPENLTYFDILGLEQKYDLDNNTVHNKYRELQKLLHPDKFSNRTETEQQISERLSSFVNKAYSTLIHPLKRGLYMLKLNDISIPEGTTNLNPEFLMGIMELNEKVAEAVDDKNIVIQLISENNEKLAHLTKIITEAFRAGDLETAKSHIIKMKYYSSISERLKKSKENLGIVD